MANTLLEALQNKVTPPGAVPAGPVGGVGAATDQAASLLKTKLTGQAAPTAGGVPGRVATGEQLVAGQEAAANKTLAAELALKQQQQQQQSAGQEQNAEIGKNAELQDRESKKAAYNQQTSNILSEFERGTKQLKTAKDISDLEQVGFMARLQNNKYLDDLSRAATKEGITSDLAFKEKYQEQVFADSMGAFKDNLDFNTLMDADERDFKEQVSSMNLEQAIQLATQQTKTAQTGAQIGAVSDLASAGMQAYAASQQKKNTTSYIEKTYADDPDAKQATLDAYANGVWYPQDGKLA